MDSLERLCQTIATTGAKVVTSAHPAATAAGAAAYAQGGNAFDAALAACFMETVALPMKCGLAGDLVALYHRADGSFETIVSVGPGPQALAQGAVLERLGPRSVGIPGAPDGYVTLHGMAELPLSKLVAPAIKAAELGLPWSWVALSYLDEAEELLGRYSPHHPYCPHGRRPQLGDLRRLPGLGQLLAAFADLGADLFTGDHGKRLVADVQSRGGFLTLADLCGRPARRMPAESLALGDGIDLLVTPGPTAGPRLAEVMRQAGNVDADLVGIVRAERQQARARNREALDEGTSVVTAADDQGNAVVVVHSNSFPRFGSGLVLESGLVLNNRPGRGFDLSAPPYARNAPAAGRVPQTTLHAWALRHGETLCLGATPGGVNQLPWNAQTIRDLLAGASPAQAVSNPRWALDEKDELTAEQGVQFGTDAAPHRAVQRFAHRSVQQVIAMRAGLPHLAAADPRSGASALGVY
ncbi:gamma-glutamyltransferase [Ferrovibrio sp.]|uniref:gamma-glutamyltransferase n=1 Tax=Ferrovibrio sp. TaxID=1917215 RepID=UPI001B5B157F|nr:gamma-glutamyltransferase [Ferrovibrio sp.]MBP7064845.1 gamma-glutamyltransferase [Ferrovibrio sp.]